MHPPKTRPHPTPDSGSGVDRGSDVIQVPASTPATHGHQIDPQGRRSQAFTASVFHRGGAHRTDLPSVERLQGRRGAFTAKAHLDEDDAVVFDGDDVDLAVVGADVALDDSKAESREEASGPALRAPAGREEAQGHGKVVPSP